VDGGQSCPRHPRRRAGMSEPMRREINCVVTTDSAYEVLGALDDLDYEHGEALAGIADIIPLTEAESEGDDPG
jgi:hypothetical protein